MWWSWWHMHYLCEVQPVTSGRLTMYPHQCKIWIRWLPLASEHWIAQHQCENGKGLTVSPDFAIIPACQSIQRTLPPTHDANHKTRLPIPPYLLMTGLQKHEDAYGNFFNCPLGNVLMVAPGKMILSACASSATMVTFVKMVHYSITSNWIWTRLRSSSWELSMTSGGEQAIRQPVWQCLATFLLLHDCGFGIWHCGGALMRMTLSGCVWQRAALISQLPRQ